jgi:hypothetical protein
MAEKIGVHWDESTVDAVKDVRDEEGADSTGEAFRMTVRAGLHDMGYLNGHTRETGLRKGVREVGKLFAYAAIAWAGATYFYALEWRLPAVALVIGAMVCFGVDRALEAYEPGVSRRLGRLFGRGERA